MAAARAGRPVLVIRLGASALSFKTEGSIYTNNPSFNNAYYRLDFKQELEPKKTSLELIYRYTPHLVLGSGRVSSQANTFDEQRTTSHICSTGTACG